MPKWGRIHTRRVHCPLANGNQESPPNNDCQGRSQLRTTWVLCTSRSMNSYVLLYILHHQRAQKRTLLEEVKSDSSPISLFWFRVRRLLPAAWLGHKFQMWASSAKSQLMDSILSSTQYIFTRLSFAFS